MIFCGWLQLNLRPFKHTLMNVIKRWSWMFKEHLLNHVNQRLDKWDLGMHSARRTIHKL